MKQSVNVFLILPLVYTFYKTKPILKVLLFDFMSTYLFSKVRNTIFFSLTVITVISETLLTGLLKKRV